MNNTFFVVCFKWIENKSGMNLWQKLLKEKCIVKVTAKSIADAFDAVKNKGFYTDGNSYAESMQSYIRTYERYLAEGVPGYYAI